ncbi:MAG: hypothetical protein RR269_07045 [Oscillospiraceae bacterium]
MNQSDKNIQKCRAEHCKIQQRSPKGAEENIQPRLTVSRPHGQKNQYGKAVKAGGNIAKNGAEPVFQLQANCL